MAKYGTGISKRIISCIFIILLLFTSAGCKDDSKATAGGKNAAADCETITLCFKGGYSGYLMGQLQTGQPGNLPAINEMVAELNKMTQSDLNIKVEFVWLPYTDDYTYEEGLVMELMSGDAPDAFEADGGMLDKLTDKGLVKDLTELVPTCAPVYYSVFSETWGSSRDYSYKRDGRIFAIPNNDAVSDRYCVVARDDLVEKYMLDGIKTLDDYCAFLSNVKENESNIVPGLLSFIDFAEAYMTEKGYYFITPFIAGRWDDDDINLVPVYDTREFGLGMVLHLNLEYTGFNSRSKTLKHNVAESKYASIFDRISALNGKYGNFLGDIKYTMYPLDFDNYSFKRTERFPLFDVPQSSLCINIGSGKAESVLLFVEWLQSYQERYDMVMYGIKDKHYKLSGDYLDFTGIENNKSVVNWMGSDVFRNYLFEKPFPYEPEDYLDFRRKCVQGSIVTEEELFDMKGYDYEYGQFSNDAKGETIMQYENTLLTEYYEYARSIDENRWMSVAYKFFDQIVDDNGLRDESDAVLDFYKTQLKEMKKVK